MSWARSSYLLSFALLTAACSSRRAPPPSDAGIADGGTPNRPARDGGAPPSTDMFPLRRSDDGHYLVDGTGQPFLINQASSWGLIQSLSTADATQYMDELAARGFNALLVSIISNDARMPGEPPAWRGIDPFETRWDFSTPNNAYFDHADEILRLARARGMLVELVPCYLGFAGDDSQGWQDELLSATNSADKSRAYGEFLGARYEGFDNIVWVAGGDNTPPAGSELETRLRAVVDGIRARDPKHLWTAHWASGETGVMASENPTFASIIDLDGYYAYDYDLTYEKDLEFSAKRPARPVFHLDMSYETEPGGEPANIRRKAYTAILSGAVGSSFNAGPDWYLFKDWQNMNTEGTRETSYWYRFFSALPWQRLVPDRDHRALVSGYGSYGDTDYVAAARTREGDLLLAYLPAGGTVTIDLTTISGERARAAWFDPTTGRTTQSGEFATEGTTELSAPSRSSWALVVGDATHAWKLPGIQ
jgi:hypothetical protein